MTNLSQRVERWVVAALIRRHCRMRRRIEQHRAGLGPVERLDRPLRAHSSVPAA
ncbi:MAG: hypothetical protein WD250_06810 [Egibacteraceae bacterium]